MNALYTQVDGLLQVLQARTDSGDSSLQGVTNNAVNESPSSNGDANHLPNLSVQAISRQAQHRGQTVYEQLADGGYITAENWAQTSVEIEKMSPDENKAFWESMNAALTKGDLQVLIPDSGES